MTTIVPLTDTITANGTYSKTAPANTAYSPINLTVNVPTKIILSGVQIGTSYFPFKNILLWSTAGGNEIQLADGDMYFAYQLETNSIRFYYLKNHYGQSISFIPPQGIKFLREQSNSGEVTLFQTVGSQNLLVMYLLNDITQDVDPNQLLVSSNFFDLELS